MNVTVLIVDDHPVVRTGLRAVLDGSRASGAGSGSAEQTIRVVGEAATGEESLVLAAELQPDVVLCDLRLGAGIDGIAATAALRALDPAPAVLILTTFDRDAEVRGAIEAGAAGYLLKEAPPGEIIDAILHASRGGMHLSPELAERVVRGLRTPIPRLTQRETEVLRLLATGATNQEIAQQLFVSGATVKSHLAHIFEKLGADSRARAVHVARETGLI